MAEEQELLSPQQAAQRLGVSRQLVRRVIDYGELEAQQLQGPPTWQVGAEIVLTYVVGEYHFPS